MRTACFSLPVPVAGSYGYLNWTTSTIFECLHSSVRTVYESALNPGLHCTSLFCPADMLLSIGDLLAVSCVLAL